MTETQPISRTTAGFSDGRVHVTLLDGAFDLAQLLPADRMVWNAVLHAFRSGASLARLESFLDGSGSSLATRLRNREPLASLYADLCRRVALEERGLAHIVGEMLPWRIAQSRALYERALGYHPAGLPAIAA